jgi:hypothetical protein
MHEHGDEGAVVQDKQPICTAYADSNLDPADRDRVYQRNLYPSVVTKADRKQSLAADLLPGVGTQTVGIELADGQQALCAKPSERLSLKMINYSARSRWAPAGGHGAQGSCIAKIGLASMADRNRRI